MRSAFGVEDSRIAKRETVPDWMTSALPASTVMAYNRSKKHKGQAAASNFGAKAAGGAAGTAAGALAVGLLAGRVKGLRGATKVGRLVLSQDKKVGAAQAVGGGIVGGVTGGVTGNRSLNRIKGDKRYGYR